METKKVYKVHGPFELYGLYSSEAKVRLYEPYKLYKLYELEIRGVFHTHLLFQQLRHFFLQLSATQVLADDFVVLVEQESIGDAHEVVHAGDGRALGFQVGEMFPDHAVFLDGFFPGTGIVI